MLCVVGALIILQLEPDVDALKFLEGFFVSWGLLFLGYTLLDLYRATQQDQLVFA